MANNIFIILVILGIASTMDSREPDIQLLNWNESVSSLNTTLSTQTPPALYSVLDKTEQGYVNLGSLQSFTTTLTAQEKEDVIDSILMAQLTASHMYNRETEYSEWYRIYVEALRKFGWMVDSYHFMEYTPTSNTINLVEATLKLIRLLCVKPIQLQVSKNLLRAYSNLLSSDHRVLMFNNHTTQLSGDLQASFQVLPAASILDGVTSIVFSNFHFKSSKPTYRYLTFDWKAQDVKLQAAISVGSLRHAEYDIYRETVRKHLGNAAKEFVLEVPL